MLGAWKKHVLTSKKEREEIHQVSLCLPRLLQRQILSDIKANGLPSRSFSALPIVPWALVGLWKVQVYNGQSAQINVVDWQRPVKLPCIHTVCLDTGVE